MSDKTMKVKALYDYVLFKESQNPFLKKKTKSGIFIPEGLVPSQETGNIEQLDQVIGFGIVEVAGTECKYLKAGDGIFYDRRSIRPVPMSETLWQFSERNVVAYVEGDDEFLTEAFAENEADAVAQQLAYRKAHEEERAAAIRKGKEFQAKIDSGEAKELSPIIKIN